MRKHALQPRGARGAAYRGGEHMKRKVFALLLVAAPPFVALPAHAVPNIEHLTVKPSGGAPTEVEIAVSINRPTPLDLSCDAILQTGDGRKPQRLEYGLGDRRTKIIKYTYKTAGTYRVRSEERRVGKECRWRWAGGGGQRNTQHDHEQ